MMTCLPGHACYRCVFKEMPKPGSVPSSAQAGILGAVPGVFGSLQASEAIKFILGKGEMLVDKMLVIDLLSMSSRTVVVKASSDCKVCGGR